MGTQKIRVGLEKSAKLSFPFNTNHKKPTHRKINAVKLWNNSLGKVVNLFWERSLKYKINDRNLCNKLEGSKLLLIISVCVGWLSIQVCTCKIQLKNKSVFQSTIQVKFNSTPWLKLERQRKTFESGSKKVQSSHSHSTQITWMVLTGSSIPLRCGTIPLVKLWTCFGRDLWNIKSIIVSCVISWKGRSFYWQFQYVLIDLIYRFALVK